MVSITIKLNMKRYLNNDILLDFKQQIYNTLRTTYQNHHVYLYCSENNV